MNSNFKTEFNLFVDILALNPVGLHEDSIRTSHGDSSDSQCSRPSVVGLSDEKDDDHSVSTST